MTSDTTPTAYAARAGTAAELREAVARTTAWQEASTGGIAIGAALEASRTAPAEVIDRLAGAERIAVTGAGSSFYIAQVAAAAMRARCRLPAEAVPLSEVLLRPEGVFGAEPAERQPVIVISRSGTTTEAIDVIGLAAGRGQPSIAVTCRPASPMAQAADLTLAVPAADERAIVMTRSFVAQSALLMRLGARVATERGTVPLDDRFAGDLDAIPTTWGDAEPHIERALELALADPSRVVVLGGGAAHGIANEAVLKLTETSQVPASAFHPLEFRHGPISVCEPGMLVVGVLGGDAEVAERRVLAESEALGAMTWVLGPDGPGAGLDEIARLPLVLYPLQALALGVAIRRGRDPEAPRHLSQVVVIEEA
jgi:glucosamine--fructose-6-phosphate aminotransferase (isomerizing)